MTEQPALKPLVVREHLPQSAPVSDEDHLQTARDLSQTIYHPTSTCRMGADEAAVVAPDLKVNGIQGLRIADASIMPTIPSGNTNAPAIMVGEKCSDLILAARRA